MRLNYRMLIAMTCGATSADNWALAAKEERPVVGAPKACVDCPLRVGGEWEAGAKAAVAQATERQKATLRRWGCHEGDTPCAGMRRILAAKEGS